MTRKIIIYNEFARDAAHVQLLQRQLSDVKRDLLTCDSAEHRRKLVNERELLQRHLRKHTRDSSGAFAGGELIAQESRYGRDERTTTLNPAGPHRDAETYGQVAAWKAAVRAKHGNRVQFKQKVHPGGGYGKIEAFTSGGEKLPHYFDVVSGSGRVTDGVGSPEEQAYGRGWHEYNTANPYDDPVLAKAWEKGRAAGALNRKLRGNSFRGGVRGQGRTASRTEGPIAGSRDYQSERGYVAKFVSKEGKTLARSEPFITEARAKEWVQANIKAMVNKGHRGFTNAVEHTFYDPAKAADTGVDR